jgi:hypothetical protein
MVNYYLIFKLLYSVEYIKEKINFLQNLIFSLADLKRYINKKEKSIERINFSPKND